MLRWLRAVRQMVLPLVAVYALLLVMVHLVVILSLQVALGVLVKQGMHICLVVQGWIPAAAARCGCPLVLVAVEVGMF